MHYTEEQIRSGLKNCLFGIAYSGFYLVGRSAFFLFFNNHDVTKNLAENKAILRKGKIYLGPSWLNRVQAD